MILYPLNSLSLSEHVSEIIVLTQEPDVLKVALSSYQISHKVRFHKSSNSIAHSVLSCIEQYKLTLPLMVTTADNCLLKVEDIDLFLTQALDTSAELAIGFAQKDKVIAAYPEVRRTWLPFSDVEVTGCNLYLFTSDKSRELVSFWEKYETSPKKHFKLAWALGPALFWNFLFRKLSLAGTFRRISSITGIMVVPVLMENPAVSIDADKFTDIRQIESILARDIKNVIAEPVSQQSGRPLVIFDLDRTITSNGTYTPFLLNYALTQNPLRLLYFPLIMLFMLAHTLGLMDRKKLKSVMFGLLIGHPDKVDLDRICTAYVDRTLDNNIHPDALYTIREWQKKNAYLILATASYDWMANIFSQRLKFDKVIATQSILKDGKIVPGVDGENCYGMAKLRMVTAALETISERVLPKPDIWFYTDHHTDIPLLNICNHPVAVNATRKLRHWMQFRADGLSLDWQSGSRRMHAVSLFISIVLFSLTVILFATVSDATEKEINISDVPEAAIRAFAAEAPGMDITRASVGSEDNAIIYELAGISVDRRYEIEVTAEGKILEVEEDVWL